MSSEAARLDLQRERQIAKLFPRPVRLLLLCNGNAVGNNWKTLVSKANYEGKCVVVIYMKSGSVRGVYSRERLDSFRRDEDAFVFEVSEQEAIKYPVLLPQNAAENEVIQRTSWVKFGNAIRLNTTKMSTVEFGSDGTIYTSTGWDELKEEDCEVELFRVQDLGQLLHAPWRTLSWSEMAREDLLKNFVSFKLPCEDLSQVRVLLLGPPGAGKSSFIISARSLMYKRVTHMPIVGSRDDGFTKKMTSYNIRAGRGAPNAPLTLCDVMAIDEEDSGLSLADTLAIIKGHVPEGYKFQSDISFSEKSPGYRANPSLKDKIHCVLYVLDASKISFYPSGLRLTFEKLCSEISDLYIPQMILLTHIDQVCHAVQEDVKHVYFSRALQNKMEEAAKVVQMPVSYVLPVKNYVSEHTVDCNMDILLLYAFQHILQAVDDALDDQNLTSSIASSQAPDEKPEQVHPESVKMEKY